MTNTLKNKFSRLVILASFFSLLTSCGQGLLLPKDLATLLGNKRLLSITITAAGNATSVQLADTLQFTAMGTYSDGTTEDITSKATWSSSVPATASIDASTGLVTGVSIKIVAPFPAFTATLEDVTSNAYSLSCTPPPGKRTFVTTATFNGNVGGVAGADARCMADPQSAGETYKAMIVDGVNRRACTSGNCVIGGVSEQIDWVFQPNTYYYRIDNSTWIDVTNANGLLNIPLANTYRDPEGTQDAFRVWAGLTNT